MVHKSGRIVMQHRDADRKNVTEKSEPLAQSAHSRLHVCVDSAAGWYVYHVARNKGLEARVVPASVMFAPVCGAGIEPKARTTISSMSSGPDENGIGRDLLTCTMRQQAEIHY